MATCRVYVENFDTSDCKRGAAPGRAPTMPAERPPPPPPTRGRAEARRPAPPLSSDEAAAAYLIYRLLKPISSRRQAYDLRAASKDKQD